MDSAPYPCPQILEFYCTFHLKVKLKVGVMPESVPFSQTEVRELFRMAQLNGFELRVDHSPTYTQSMPCFATNFATKLLQT